MVRLNHCQDSSWMVRKPVFDDQCYGKSHVHTLNGVESSEPFHLPYRICPVWLKTLNLMLLGRQLNLFLILFNIFLLFGINGNAYFLKILLLSSLGYLVVYLTPIYSIFLSFL